MRLGSPCGTVAVDTEWTGLVDRGCAASAPCCPVGSAAGCTGTPGTYCPPSPTGANAPPGGPGQGLTDDFTIPAGITQVYMTAYGVCGGTANRVKLLGTGGSATCPK